MEIQNNNEISNPVMPNFETSKYGVTVDTKENVWKTMKEMGLKTPTNEEIDGQDIQDITLDELNNVERIINGIIENRQYNQDEKIRQAFKGLHVKEYWYNDNIVEQYAEGFEKTNEEIKDAIIKVFNKHFGVEDSTIGTDYIKKPLMIKLLEDYFNSNNQEKNLNDNCIKIIPDDGFSIESKDNGFRDDGFSIESKDNGFRDDGFSVESKDNGFRDDGFIVEPKDNCINKDEFNKMLNDN